VSPPARAIPDPTARGARDRLGGTDGNERLTAATAAVLTALLIAEGITILFLRPLLGAHMFIGLLLVGPVALKLGSTGYRFARYYTGSRRYRAKGPPLLPLRLLAPVLVASTVLVFGTGIALLLLGHRSGLLLEAHKVAFIVWGACFGVHFLAYLPRAWRSLRATASRAPGVPGAMLRSGLVTASIAGGVVLALALLSLIEAWHGGTGG
jgi:hypothetical protein